MKYIKVFEEFSKDNILIIVDVQKSFSKFFSEMYLNELKKYCKGFDKVYQIWDNHVDGKNVDKDYLYDDNPEIPIHDDLYHFPNQTDLIEKRYTYDVDVDFFKKLLDKDVYNSVKDKEDNKTFVEGDYFPTKSGTIIVYIGNKHRFYHLPKKLYDLFIGIKEVQGSNNTLDEITIVGGASGECLEDIVITATALGVKLKQDYRFIYSACHCPM